MSGSNNENIDYLSPTPVEDYPPVIHVSKKAAKSIKPIRNKLKEWMPGNTETWMITPDDVKRVKDIEKYYKGLPQSLQDKFSEEEVEEILDYVGNRQTIAALGFLEDKDIFLLIMPPENLPKEYCAFLASASYTTSSTHIPFHKFENLPGTDREWRSLFVAHEIGHMWHRRGLEGSLPDINADQKSIDFFQDINPHISEAFMGMRAMNAVLSLFDSPYLSKEHKNGHLTNVAVSSGEHDLIPPTFSEDDLEGYQESFFNLYERITYDAGIEVLQSKGEDISGDERSNIMDVGRDVVMESKGTLYESIYQSYIEGSLSDDPITEHFAWEFLEAGRKYAPGYFSVENPEEALPVPRYYDTVDPSPISPLLDPMQKH